MKIKINKNNLSVNLQELNRLQLIDIGLIMVGKTKRQIAEETDKSMNAVSNWCNGKMASKDITRHFEQLFGAEFMSNIPAH